MKALYNIYHDTFDSLAKLSIPVILLAMRLHMAMIFWNSGQSKIANWGETLGFFKDIYQVPLLTPEFAAYSSTFFELTCPVLLILGLFTRVATVPMLVITAVIQFTFISSVDHFIWALLLGTIMCNGAGVLSLDYLLKKQCCR